MVEVSQQIALGIASIDSQHRELAGLFDEFDRCIKTDAPLQEVQALVKRALAKANAHFEHEEALIAATNYPKAEEHKFLHRHLRTEFTTLVGDAMAIKAHDPVALQQLNVMRAMLMEHIGGPDAELAEHLKQAGIR